MDYWQEFFEECGVDDSKQKVFRKLLEFYLNKRQYHNFTAIRDEKNFVLKHFFDSVMGMKVFQESEFGSEFLAEQKGVSCLDVGTGGGFPGVPLAVMNEEYEFEVLDAIGKNVRMINELAEEFDLENLEAIQARAEDFAHDEGVREDFEIVMTRAFADWSLLLELCLPFVKVGGVLLAYQGPNRVKEFFEYDEVFELLGGEAKGILDYQLPDGAGDRSIVIVQKVRKGPKKYPRNMGIIKKKPLLEL